MNLCLDREHRKKEWLATQGEASSALREHQH